MSYNFPGWWLTTTGLLRVVAGIHGGDDIVRQF